MTPPKPLGLLFIWKIRLKFIAEGAKLWAEGVKLRAEGAKLWAEGVIEAYGNVMLSWSYREKKNDFACTVEGETFEP